MMTLLAVSLIGGMMILVITGFRALLQNRLHRTVFLVLWLLAALRLAVPGVMSSTVSIYNLLPREDGYAVVEIVPMIPYEAENSIVPEEVPVEIIGSPVDSVPVVYPVGGSAVNTVEPASPMGDAVLPWIWAGGSGICFLYFAWIHIRARLRYRFALPEEGPAYLGRIRLKRSDEISAPLVYGFFRPVILLPVDFPKKDSPEYEQVLYHELTHVRSGDLWYKLGMLLVTCVHWFNPMVWLMLHLSTQDLELRCDARVIRKLGKKKIYAMTLVQAETQRIGHFAEAAFAFSLTELRLKAIAKAKVYLPRSIVLCAILAVVLVCCFSTGPRAKEKVHTDTPTEATEQSDMQTTEPTQTEPTETEAETEPKPLPTLSMDEETEMEYLLGCDYETYGSAMELSLKEGERQTLALKLPEDITFAMDAQGREKLSLGGSYSYDEELYYLTLTGLDEGETVVYISVAGHRWMTLQVEILFDLYYSIPDAGLYDTYGGSYTASISSRGSQAVSLKLPERATYVYELQQYGESIPDYYLSTVHWYDGYHNSFHIALTPDISYGNAVFYFYVDGHYWCKLNVSFSPSSGYSNSSGSSYRPSNNNSYNNYNNYGNSSSGVYDYLSGLQSQVGYHPIREQYTGYGNQGPIQVFSTIYAGNGQIIRPGVYWPGQ